MAKNIESKFERETDILKIISSLDITPTMYKNAIEKYHAIADFLSDCGIDAEMYPQGSFAFGTIIRPLTKDPDASYDLDFICQINTNRDSITPGALRKKILDVLVSSGRYGGGKLSIYEECFTVEYADVNGVGFQIDIIPAVDENEMTKMRISRKSQRPDLIPTSIAIPKDNGERNYYWITNNPRGLKKWFDEINGPFLLENSHQNKETIFEQNKNIFASVEDVPDGLERSSIQRVIQILKCHRDNYFSHLQNGEEIQPISAIINVLVAQISSSYGNKGASIIDLLTVVLSELDIYAKHQSMPNAVFENVYGNRKIITHIDGIWRIENPANPEDNLADSWNENADVPKAFFSWIMLCKNDLVDSLDLPDKQFRSKMENVFGSYSVQKNWGTKYNPVPPKPINNASSAKPYGED